MSMMYTIVMKKLSLMSFLCKLQTERSSFSLRIGAMSNTYTNPLRSLAGYVQCMVSLGKKYEKLTVTTIANVAVI